MYRYTKNNKYISNELRDHYEENGFMVLRNLVDNRLLDECKQRFIDYCNGTASNEVRLTIMNDLALKSKNAKGEFLVNKIQEFLYDIVFFKYACYGPMVDVIESIIGPNITACHSMLINKPPDTDKELSEHPIHQDLHYFPFRPADSIVASWTAMERIDQKNGCLFVLPGSHKAGQLYTHEYMTGAINKPMYHGIKGPVEGQPVNLVMEKGDTVLFHPLLVHGSLPNSTKGFRKAISCHYADTNCDFINVAGTNQEALAKEVMGIAKRRHKVDIPFTTIWKAKSRLVRGSPGNFQNLDSKL